MDVFISLVPIVLFGVGIFYIFRLRFFYILHPIKTFKGLFVGGGGDGISPLGALSMALAGTLGVGNIVGVASAIALGGVGAVFWMVASAIVAMVLKYAEVVLAVRHRRFEDNGQPYGGASYYIRDSFASIGFARLGGSLAAVFSLLCIFNAVVMGNSLQINTITGAFYQSFAIPKLPLGIILAVFCTAVSVGGAKKVARFTAMLVPAMSVLFVVMCMAVIIICRDRLPWALGEIMRDAFSIRSVGGGIAGYFLAGGIRYGTMRGLISNEAGSGTATMAHATADVISPAAQGALGIVEVFVDTVVMCSMTALVVILGGRAGETYGGDLIAVVQSCFSNVLGLWAEDALAVCVLLFAVATVLCQAHYGKTCVEYFTHSRVWRGIFYAVFFAATVIGSVTGVDIMFDMSDIGLAIMTFINLAALVIFRHEVSEETKLLVARQKINGKIKE